MNYDGSMKAFLFLLNSRCNVSLEKTAQFVSDVTDGALSPSVGMINGLCREFSSKSRAEQDSLFKIYVDTDVFALPTNNINEVTSTLESGNYIYLLPITTSKGTVVVNI